MTLQYRANQTLDEIKKAKELERKGKEVPIPDEDMDVILKELSNWMDACDTAKSRFVESSFMPDSLKGVRDFDAPTYTEWCLFKEAVSTVYHFLYDIRESARRRWKTKEGSLSFSYPPIEFYVDKITVYITKYPRECRDLPGDIEKNIKKNMGSRYKVVEALR